MALHPSNDVYGRLLIGRRGSGPRCILWLTKYDRTQPLSLAPSCTVSQAVVRKLDGYSYLLWREFARINDERSKQGNMSKVKSFSPKAELLI